MFETVQTSPRAGPGRSRAVLGAIVSHVLVIGLAVGGTTPGPVAQSRVQRDTIRFQMTELEPAPPTHPAPDAFLPDAPPAPHIPLDAPEMDPPTLRFGIAAPNHSTGFVPSGNRQPVPAVVDSSDRVFNAVEVDQLPELIGGLQPRYPAALERSGVSGLVQVEYVVGSNGRMDRRTMRVLIGTHREFSLAAVAALNDARFRPAHRGGRPIAVLVQQTIRFRQR